MCIILSSAAMCALMGHCDLKRPKAPDVLDLLASFHKRCVRNFPGPGPYSRWRDLNHDRSSPNLWSLGIVKACPLSRHR